jgi:hypothetical protein
MTNTNGFNFLISSVQDYPTRTSPSSSQDSSPKSGFTFGNMEAEGGLMNVDDELPGLITYDDTGMNLTSIAGTALQNDSFGYTPIEQYSAMEIVDLTSHEERSEAGGAKSDKAYASSTASDSDIEVFQPKTKRISVSLSTKPTLAQQLAASDFITFPQVLGKGAVQNPSIIDSFIATPALKVALENETHPAEVLWASFLKNNVFILNSGAASDNMQVWLSAQPHRYKHITTLIFEDFFSHPTPRASMLNPANISTYRPIRLMAKCPNLKTIVLRCDIDMLPGFSKWSFPHTLGVKKMARVFGEKYRIGDLLTKTSRTVREISLVVYMDEWTWRNTTPRAAEQWQKEIKRYFAGVAVDAGWSKELEKLQFQCHFKRYDDEVEE